MINEFTKDCPDVEAQVFAINDSVEGDEVVPASLARELVGMLAEAQKVICGVSLIVGFTADSKGDIYDAVRSMRKRAEVAERRVRELELDFLSNSGRA